MSCCSKHRARGGRFVLGILAVLALAFAATGLHADDLSPPAAPDAGLGPDEAVRLALDGQPLITAQQARSRALQQEATAAAQLPDPKLRLGLASLPLDTFSFTQEPMSQAVVGVTQAVPGGRKRAVAAHKLDLEDQRMRSTVQVSQRRIARDARLAWLETYQPEQALLLLRAIAAEFERQIEWSEVAYRNGTLTQDETLALRGRLEQTRDQIAEQARLAQRGRASLRRWLGPVAERPLAALGHEALPTARTVLDAALDTHPELQVLGLASETARAEAELARQAYKPDWSVDMAYGYRGAGRADFISLMVGIDLPVFTANRQDRRLAAREAQVTETELNREDRKRSLAAELQLAWADYVASDARVQHYRDEILPLAQRRSESALAVYGTGKAPYARVLEARRAVLEARLGLLAQTVARARAQAQLRYFDPAEGDPS